MNLKLNSIVARAPSDLRPLWFKLQIPPAPASLTNFVRWLRGARLFNGHTHMSFILVPQNGEDLQVNGWTWRRTLELLLAKNLICDENYERMGAQGCGGQVDGEVARRIADVIDHKLAEIKPEERMLA